MYHKQSSMISIVQIQVKFLGVLSCVLLCTFVHVYDDVIMWKFFCALLFAENSPFPPQRTSDADFYVYLMWVSISCLTNNQMTCDLRLHDVHVTSFQCKCCLLTHKTWYNINLSIRSFVNPFFVRSWFFTDRCECFLQMCILLTLYK